MNKENRYEQYKKKKSIKWKKKKLKPVGKSQLTMGLSD